MTAHLPAATTEDVQPADHAACTSPVLGEVGRALNDILPDGPRQQLASLIPDLPGTADDGHDEARTFMAVDWLVRTWLPTWLELSPSCRQDAAKIRELGKIVGPASAERASGVVRDARDSAVVTWVATSDADWDAARDAARVAAGATVPWVDAVNLVARVAGPAGDAAWDAVGVAAGDAARVAAAMAAARAAAGDAAWDAAWAHLQPAVTAVQESAIDLYGRMARIGGQAGLACDA